MAMGLANRSKVDELRTKLTNARLVVNDWHSCASEEELVRWRLAQSQLIEAARILERAEIEACINSKMKEFWG
jgi:hypothetical protein